MPWSAHLSQQVLIAQMASSILASSSAIPFSWLLVGALFPDYFLAAKAWIYLKEPSNGRTGLLGAGHSIPVAIVVAVLLFGATREGAIAFLLGAVSHILSDLTDSRGCALFYPFTSRRINLSLWTYSADRGLIGDLRAFCSDWKAIAVELIFGIWGLVVLLRWFGIAL